MRPGTETLGCVALNLVVLCVNLYFWSKYWQIESNGAVVESLIPSSHALTFQSHDEEPLVSTTASEKPDGSAKPCAKVLSVQGATQAPHDVLRTQTNDDVRSILIKMNFTELTRAALSRCEYDASDLVDFVVLEPQVPPNPECSPPKLTKPDCSKFSVFSGPLEKTSKVGVLLQFGFDVDVLEIALNEYYPIADRIFIAESTRQHRHAKFKRMILSTVLRQDRFKKFSDKVVSLVLDDSYVPVEKGDIWTVERAQEKYLFDAFIRWNAKTKHFTSDDILGFGDTDEIPSIHSINLMRSCKWKDDSKGIDVGIWFPRDSVEWAFKTDFPVSYRLPYTLGDPTYFKLSHALQVSKQGKILTRKRGTSRNYILGGMHMSDMPYLPFRLLKEITCTECPGKLASRHCNRLREIFQGGGVQAMASYYTSMHRMEGKNRWVRRETIPKNIVAMPWFLACNKDRYPYWFNKPDTRLD